MIIDEAPIFDFAIFYNVSISDMNNAFGMFGDIGLMGD
jgi:hypothetical protein